MTTPGNRARSSGRRLKDVDQLLVRHPDTTRCIIVQRVSSVPAPTYRTFAKTRCLLCQQWCWLGVESFRFVNTEQGIPCCVECGAERDITTSATMIGVIEDP